jgi:hypothetical protein
MKKQTAVDWLLEQWPILESQIPPRIIEQAKEIEKESSEISFFAGYNYEGGNPIDEHEQYYTQTFTEPKND